MNRLEGLPAEASRPSRKFLLPVTRAQCLRTTLVRNLLTQEGRMSRNIRGKGETRAGEALQDILARRVARRSFLKGAFVGGPLLVIGSSLLCPRDSEAND